MRGHIQDDAAHRFTSRLFSAAVSFVPLIVKVFRLPGFRLPLIVAASLLALSLSAGARADVVVLDDGSRLQGSVKELKDGLLVIRTSYAGPIRIPFRKAVAIDTDGLVTVRFKAGGTATGRLHSPRGNEVQIVPDGGSPSATVALSEIAEIHPGTEMPGGFTWKGHINIGLAVLSGNTDSESFRADGSVQARRGDDRIKARGDFNRETDAGSRIEDNYTFALQHDHFVTKKLFFYTNVKFEHDEIALLNLRTTLGTGLGYQFIGNGRTNLSVEAGPAYIIEDFKGSPDNESVAGRWAVNYDQYVWKRFAQLFHFHEGLVNLEETDEVLLDSSTGLRLFVYDGLNVTLQLDLDWENDPPPGVSSLDKKYMMTVGYKW